MMTTIAAPGEVPHPSTVTVNPVPDTFALAPFVRTQISSSS